MKQNTILLGMYHTPQWDEQYNKFCYITYPFEEILGDDWVKYTAILDRVQHACIKADEIIFLLDELKPNYHKKGITNKELEFILNNPEVLAKTTFLNNGIQQSKRKVIKIYGCKETRCLSVEGGVVNKIKSWRFIAWLYRVIGKQ